MEATITKLGVQDIPLEEILVVTNPRKRFDEDALADLARSIDEDGLLQAILVRVTAEREDDVAGVCRVCGCTDDDCRQCIEATGAPCSWVEPALCSRCSGYGYELVAGERRLRAHRLNGAATIRADVREMSRAKAAELRLVENLQREDLHELEEAHAYHELLESGEFTVETLAERVGKSVSYVYQRLKLRELIPPAQEAFFEDEITAGHAILIARLSPEDQQRALEAMTDSWSGERKSVRGLAHWIQHQLHLSLEDAAWDRKDVDLVPEAGSCDTCPKRAGSNPELYPDLEPDTCTDRACYAAKEQAFVDRAIARLEAKEDGPVVRLSTRWSPSPNGKKPKKDRPLGAGEWREVTSKRDRCEHTAAAVITDAPHQPRRLGQRVQVCANPKCKKHHGGHRRELSAEEKKRRARLKIDAAEAKILRDRILETVSSPPSTALLRILARRAWDEVWSQNTRAVAKDLGFDENAVGQLDAYMAEASDEELLAVLTRLLIQKLVGESGHEYVGDGTIKRLREIAGELGVDVKAARAEATPKKGGKKRSQTSATAGAA